VSIISQLGRASLASGEDFWSRYWEISSRYFERASVNAVSAGVGSPSPSGDLWQTFTREYRHYFAEMAMVPWLAAERFGAELGRVGRAASEPRQRTWYIQSKPVMLPVRIQDASQGLAVYAVSTRLVQKILDDKREPFRASELGGDRTPLMIFIAHYREGDLGTHGELGIAFFVIPQGDPSAMPGLYIKALPVNDEFSRDAGRQIWGYPKTMMKGLQIEYKDDYREKQACCTLWEGDRALLSITFLRGGTGSSTAIPIATYTLLHGRAHRTIFTRSGKGERIGAGGGQVKLMLGAEKDLSDEQDDLGHTLRLLRTLGLPEKSPILHAWTEHMSGAFGIPQAL
jgi:hypothetical protein